MGGEPTGFVVTDDEWNELERRAQDAWRVPVMMIGGVNAAEVAQKACWIFFDRLCVEKYHLPEPPKGSHYSLDLQTREILMHEPLR